MMIVIVIAIKMSIDWKHNKIIIVIALFIHIFITNKSTHNTHYLLLRNYD